jgi:soluble lytic murein transglycosylase-like protein
VNAIVLAFLAALVLAGSAQAQPQLQAPLRVHAQAASERFGLKADLIEAVILAESGGDPRVVSRAGAMGLMQLMPGTWAQLRSQLALGPDPFDPHDNVLAGSAYLRALLDRYGSPGFLAAYNAGPGRYEQSLQGRPLPAETLAYVAKLSGRIAGLETITVDWRETGLFPTPWPADLGGSEPVATPSGQVGGGLFAPRGERAR